MKRAKFFYNKNKVGRPHTGVGKLVGQRWHQDQLDQVDQWRRGQPDMPGRAEAVRRLVELGLTVKDAARSPAAPDRALRAQELASKAIAKIGDPAAPAEERAQRQRGLTKGPEEFREVRVDRPKAKAK
jgi:hypothetical protein